MTESQLVESILLNLGDKTPVLLVVFMFMKYMWPDVKGLLGQYLDCRIAHLNQPDPLAQSVAGLSARIDALMQGVAGIASTLSSYVDESRRSGADMAQMVKVTVGLVGDVARDRLRASAASAQSPVSPTVAEAVEGVDSGAARVQG
jgi:hypothetical protein